MIRVRFAHSVAMAWGLLALDAPAQEATRPDRVSFSVKAGDHDRENTPIRFELPEARFSAGDREALNRGPIPFMVWGEPADAKLKDLVVGPSASVAQAERVGGGSRIRMTFLLRGPLPKGERRSYQLQVGMYPIFSSPFRQPWLFDKSTPGALILKSHEWVGLKIEDREVFRYNIAPVSSPNYGPIQVRDAYIHPAYSPSGALITGDFSSSHPHHRGFFLAYEKTQWGDLKPDFWNIHLGSGKIHADGIDQPVAGPITARFSARHRWEAKDKATGQGTVVLRERWDVETYAIGNLYWLFDLTSTQQAVDKPLLLEPYRYGGMAYRGPEPFVKGKLDVLTSEGKHRVDGDQKPARWVDLTGPIADGSDQYAGAMIADHPSNPHYPTVARIHPTTLPFFCYVPAHDQPLTIAPDTPTIFRYRVLIHDGRPDSKLNEAVARDFAEPPVVTVE